MDPELPRVGQCLLILHIVCMRRERENGEVVSENIGECSEAGQTGLCLSEVLGGRAKVEGDCWRHGALVGSTKVETTELRPKAQGRDIGGHDAVNSRLDAQAVRENPGTRPELNLRLVWFRRIDLLVPPRSRLKI
jgi:hypothetical protein